MWINIFTKLRNDFLSVCFYCWMFGLGMGIFYASMLGTQLKICATNVYGLLFKFSKHISFIRSQLNAKVIFGCCKCRYHVYFNRFVAVFFLVSLSCIVSEASSYWSPYSVSPNVNDKFIAQIFSVHLLRERCMLWRKTHIKLIKVKQTYPQGANRE